MEVLVFDWWWANRQFCNAQKFTYFQIPFYVLVRYTRTPIRTMHGKTVKSCPGRDVWRVWIPSRENGETRCDGTLKLLTRAQRDKSSKFCVDAGFLNVAEIGQYFMTICIGLSWINTLFHEKNQHRNQRVDPREHQHCARIGNCKFRVARFVRVNSAGKLVQANVALSKHCTTGSCFFNFTAPISVVRCRLRYVRKGRSRNKEFYAMHGFGRLQKSGLGGFGPSHLYSTFEICKRRKRIVRFNTRFVKLTECRVKPWVFGEPCRVFLYRDADRKVVARDRGGFQDRRRFVFEIENLEVPPMQHSMKARSVHESVRMTPSTRTSFLV